MADSSLASRIVAPWSERFNRLGTRIGRRTDRIALKSVVGYLKKHREIKPVRFVLFDSKTYQIYEAALKELVLSE
jgi:O-acetyl-ADP-ribose deacetylase (regulator of RNase III)